MCQQFLLSVHPKGAALFVEIGFYFHDVIILRTYSMAKYVAPLHTRPTVSDSPLYQKYVISPNSLRRVHSPELGDLLPRSPM